MWLIKRLKIFGASQNELLDVYCKQIRSILEYAVPVWHSGLTVDNCRDIERVQKAALAIILGKEYTSYENSLSITGLDKLKI